MEKEKTAILLSTYNGENFLEEQLKSLLNQTYSFDLYVRDDGSSDNTVSILKKYKELFPMKKYFLDFSNNIGVVKSFESLLKKIQEKKTYDWIAFCDQDDIWYPNKLEKAITKLKNEEQKFDIKIPLLYHSDLKLINSDGKDIGVTFWKSMHIFPDKGKKLNRLLCQPIVTGCTMVLNSVLIQKIQRIPDQAKMHDWWLSLYVVCKGKIISDDTPYIGYRQHANNVIGSTGFKFSRIIQTIKNIKIYIRSWRRENLERINQAEAFLFLFKSELSFEQIEVLNNFINTRNYNFWKRKKIQFKFGFFQHSFLRLPSSILFF